MTFSNISIPQKDAKNKEKNLKGHIKRAQIKKNRVQ